MNKLSYVSGISSTPLLGKTIGAAFDETVAEHSDNEALISVHQNIRWTYKELKEQVDLCALGLYAMGLRKGNRIGIWALNRAEWMVLQYATAKLGAILVNINPSYRVHELEYVLKQSGCKFLVIDEKTEHADYTALVNELLPKLQYSEPGYVRDIELTKLTTVISLAETPADGMYNWADVIRLGNDIKPSVLERIESTLHFDEAINIQ